MDALDAHERAAFKTVYNFLEEQNYHDDCAMLLAVVMGDSSSQQSLLNIRKRNEHRGYLSEEDAQLRLNITRLLRGPLDL